MSSRAPTAGREPVIQLRNLAKKYPIYDRPSQKLLELLTFRRVQFHREFWALQDLDLEVGAGVTLGVLGQNGSGKSTLLQLIAGILTPSRGSCLIRGSVAALLELGAGFNPEFTGRENVFMNGSILGLTRTQMEQRFDQISDFAEIGHFLEQPVKTYSSGMFMRLAFAVAIHVDPDILLVDEALAVGDLIFQHRCINRFQRLRREGKTIIFVTHDLQAVTQFCDRAILLDQGRKLEDGVPDHVVQRYRALIHDREQRRATSVPTLKVSGEDESLPLVTVIPYIHNRYGKGRAEIVGVLLLSAQGHVIQQVRSGEQLQLLVSVRFLESVPRPIVGFTVRDRMGVEVTASNTSYEDTMLPAMDAGMEVTVGFLFEMPDLRPGSYTISPAVSQGDIWEHDVEDWIDNAYIFDLIGSGLVYGTMRWPVEVRYRCNPGRSEQG